MKAYAINTFGDPNVFEQIEATIPEISDSEVLIKVFATSVNAIDYKIRRGDIPQFTHPFPAILHFDVSGVVEKVGNHVNHVKIGDEVYGIAGGIKDRQGCLSEYVSAPSKLVCLKPRNISLLQSAAVPLVTLTAWEALVLSVDIKKNDKILIHSGAGSVGLAAIQIAKWKGAIVYTTVSNDLKAETSKRYGADHTINYKTESVENYVKKHTDGKGFDIVFDTVGGENFDLSLKAAKLRGHIISIAAREPHDLTPAASKGLHIHMVNVTHPVATGCWHELHQDALNSITNLVENGVIKVMLDEKQFKFSEVNHAHTYVEEGKNHGKVCLSW